MLLPRLLFPHLLRFGCLLCLLCGSCAWAGSYTVGSVPNPRVVNGSHVADPDGILGAQSAQEINQLLVALEHDTGVQVAVVAVDAIEPSDIFSFAQQLFVTWGIGDKQVDNGLLVLLVKGQRTVRFHTGYGLEGSLPDLLCQRIQSVFMVPEFKQGRHGAGLLAGLGEVRRVLLDPSHAITVRQPAPPHGTRPWQAFQYLLMAFGGLASFMIFCYKWMDGHFDAKESRMTLGPGYSQISWLMAFGAVPTGIVLAWEMTRSSSPVLTCSLALYGYFMLLTFRHAWHVRRHIDRLSDQKQYFRIVKQLKEQQAFWGWMALIFPLPFLPYYAYHRSRKTHYRNHPRQCSKCGKAAHKLTEQEEDAFLSAAQQKEEYLKSADHDVWQCKGCSATVLQTYPGTETKYDQCPSCKCLAYLLESDKVLIAASYSSKGKGEKQHACHFCGHRKTVGYSIARLVSSSSSSSSSSGGGSRSSSGSWGGGSSGGGGSSSSW